MSEKALVDKGLTDKKVLFLMTLLLLVVLVLIGTLIPKQIALLCKNSQTILPMARRLLSFSCERLSGILDVIN